MKFGLKLWSINTNLVDQAVSLIDSKIFDYIELFVVPGSTIEFFSIDIPYVIHIPHDTFGVNIGDSSLDRHSLKLINESINWADSLDAKYIILHPGYGSLEHASCFLSKISDPRLLIENMPKIGLGGELMIGYSSAQIEYLIGDNEMGLCLDLAHAVKGAVSLGIDYKSYIKEFMNLDPRMFHISDGTLNVETDQHLNIGEGEYDFSFMQQCIDSSSTGFVTMETPRINLGSLAEDILNLERLRCILNYK
ncbi:deoxyribonuclease-4 [Methanolobus vulcani]|jgi:Endonuclease IV|uniref:Deoxyribonuclease-4 n=1 Tax=Methanolobus vulcani TaxID=38026 RepID=A0A7Z7AWI9_9EURY|nr:TIM barrel protein [Methanolobus vulcani]SDF57927.1 deoxyribonuclease-4 [Methanolobus vulcani]